MEKLKLFNLRRLNKTINLKMLQSHKTQKIIKFIKKNKTYMLKIFSRKKSNRQIKRKKLNPLLKIQEMVDFLKYRE